MTSGLVIFVAVVVLDATVLLLDLVHLLCSAPTVTSYLRTHKYLALAAVLVQFLVPVGLCWHLMSPTWRSK